MSARDRREDRRSTARRRAEAHQSGFATTLFNMPEDLSFWKLEKGKKRISIIGYVVGKGNPFADQGEFHYERTFYVYNKIGADENRYVAPGKTFNHKDFVQEWREKKAREKDADQELLKALTAKERQVFLVFDHDEPEKGIQLFEFSYHKFGKRLDNRIKLSDESKGWDLFYYPDEDGFMLELSVIDTGTYGLEVDQIDFEKRSKPLPDAVVNHSICLDDILRELSYDELRAKFLCLDEGEVAKEKERDESSEPRVQKKQEEAAPKQEERKPEPVKEEPKKEAVVTASDLGLSRDDEVLYEGEMLTIVKVSADGTELTLIDPEGDKIVKGVLVTRVKKPKKVDAAAVPKQEEKKADPPKEESKAKTESAPFDNKKDESKSDKDWDSDWD
jgi:hypothetical protein